MALLWVLAGLLALSGARAEGAVVHTYLPGVSKAISEAAGSCGSVTGPLGNVNTSIVDEGNLWLAEEQEEGIGERVDEFDASNGRCVSQLNHPLALVGAFHGVAVGHGTGEREVYVGAAERGAGEGSARVAVFGPAGALQAVWSGANTPNGSFAESGGGAKANVTGVAVDESGVVGDWASGDVLVSTASAATGVVDVFKPEAGGKEPPAEDIEQLTGTCATAGTSCPGEVIPFEGPGAVAVDQSNGEVFVVDKNRVVDIFRLVGLVGEYEFVGQVTGPPGGFERPVLGVAVDGGAADGGDVYVWEGGQIKEEKREPSMVDEFSVVGEHAFLGRLTGTPAGLFDRVSSVAVDPSSHDVYVGDFRTETEVGQVDVFGPDVVVPDVVTEEASGVSARGATLNGKVSTDKEGAATCRFVWGTSKSFGNVAPCEPETVGEGEEVPVRASLGHLQPGTTYYYRLQATSGKNGETNTGEESQDHTFVTAGTEIDAESTSNVASSSATLQATLNPDGASSSYYFQYGQSTTYEREVPLPPGEAIGSGVGEVRVSQHVQGLSAGTVYHYRVVALSDVEGEAVEVDGPDETFTTQSAGAVALPDGRQWEMVSPPQKHGALLEPIDAPGGTNGGVIQAAAEGNAISYIADSPTESKAQGYSNATQVLSTRGPEGWETHDLTLAHEGATDASVGPGNEYRFFTGDLSLAVVQPFGAFIAASEQEEREPSSPADKALAPAEASEQTAFLHSDYLGGNVSEPCVSSCYRPLVTGKPGFADVPSGTVFGEFGGFEIQEEGHPCPPELICGPQFVGATPDGSHVVLVSTVALTATPIAGRSLYEWDGAEPASKQLQLVSVLPESEGGAPVAEAALGNNNEDARHAISDDGSRVIFSTRAGGESLLYMRDVAKGQTVRLDAGGHHGQAAALFQVASAGGSRVLFTDTQRLTSNSGSTGGRPDLYECVIVEAAGRLGCDLSDLTPANASGEGAAVQGGVLGASEDGSWMYFVADGVLENGGGPISGAVHGSCALQTTVLVADAVCNLYVRHDDITRLVAVLSGADDPDWDQALGGEELNKMTARVSPDGGWLVFMSNRGLTGYDSEDVSSRVVGERRDEEVYLFDGVTGGVVCVSCNLSGARPAGEEYGKEGENMRVVGGDVVWEPSSWLAGDVPGWTPYRLGKARYQSRYLSDSGRVFFDSRDALVPADVNGTWDVYEWEPVGVGGCAGSGSSGSVVFVAGSGGGVGGCVGLVSSGESPDESAFLDASALGGRDGEGHEGGGDVFFLTTSRLSKADFDNSYDVYDAHECTGVSPCLPGAGEVPPACGSGDACRPAVSPQPEVFGAPASATFSGAGNPVSAVGVRVVRPLTRAQKLAAALRVCRRKAKRKRAGCEALARKRYGAKAKPGSRAKKGRGK